jgi:hypothetical protein
MMPALAAAMTGEFLDRTPPYIPAARFRHTLSG